MNDRKQKNNYRLQVELLLKILPYVSQETCFALKGGTAINFFIRDLPRLSVDIDLTYLPIESREITLHNIEASLLRIKKSILRQFSFEVREKRILDNSRLHKLFVTQNNVTVKIEPNEILRGTVFPTEKRDLSPKIEKMFELAVTDMPILSMADLYGGKICAALARQHPRDLFDIKLLIENEGITEDIRKASLIYLVSSPRPMHELLNPNPKLQDLKKTFESEFVGMTESEISYQDLQQIRIELINILLKDMTNEERQFLMSIKLCEPNWSLLPISNIQSLPSLSWKMINIKKMDKNKHSFAVNELKKVLDL